jgi:hypothetical protein
MNGALIFAFNNEQIDYLSMARWSANNIQRHLNLPTAIVTNKEFDALDYERCVLIDPEATNVRYFNDYKETLTWHNENRVDAYSLSPWDNQTLVLDADYVVASDQLSCLLDSNEEFLAHQHAYEITDTEDLSVHENFGYYRMPMWWATVMMFRRSTHAELIFQTMHMIKENWDHYRNIYGISRNTYRNDFALGIALNIVNGHTLNHAGITWDMASLNCQHRLTQIDQDHYKVEYTDAHNKLRWIELYNQDFHAMGKQQLGEIVASTC